MSVARKKEDDRISKENAALTQRMIRLPPVISHKRLEKDFQKSRGLSGQIQKYHVLKEKNGTNHTMASIQEED